MKLKPSRNLRTNEIRREAFTNGALFGCIGEKGRAREFAIACIRVYAAKTFGSNMAAVTNKGIQELISEIRKGLS